MSKNQPATEEFKVYVTMGPETDYWAPSKDDFGEYILDYAQDRLLLTLTESDLKEIGKVAVVDTVFKRSQQNNVIRFISEEEANLIEEHGRFGYILSHRPGSIKRLFLSKITPQENAVAQLDLLRDLEEANQARPRVLRDIEFARKESIRLSLVDQDTDETKIAGIETEFEDLTADEDF